MQFSSIKSKSFIVTVAICAFLCHWTAFGCGGGIFMKEIYLGGKNGSVIGNYALVDDADFDKISKYNWTAWRHRNTIYAVSGNDSKKMHRFILGLVDPKIKADHIDRNGLNNQRVNLRACQNKQNIRNSKIQSNNNTGFKGVGLHKQTGKYRSRIKVDGVQIHLGLYCTAKEAAIAYNESAIKHFGEYANINII